MPEPARDEVALAVVESSQVGAARRLAQALARVLTEPGLASRLGAAARLQVERRYDLARQTRRLEGFYDEVLAGSIQAVQK